ncbi:glycosyltransferase family A protein [Kutzneria kofuensis]|uniref:glycosyltransferase family 2 protein n=1 Tax=Kutzneria kofuensis TaxID=103725 RepID=UPI0031EE2B16
MAEASTGAGIADVSVFIPAHNAARTVGRCVETTRRCVGADVRIVVIDDRSTDGTGDIARRAGAEVVNTPPGTGGLGTARNLALRSCRTRYLAFLNSDCYPHPDWLRVLHAELTAAGAVIAGGRQDELRDGTIAERWKAVHLRQDLGDRDIDDPDFLSGGNLVIDLTRLHGTDFDPAHTIAYEDVAFCRKLRAAGERLVYRAAAAVDHDHHETLRTLPRKVCPTGRSAPRSVRTTAWAGRCGPSCVCTAGPTTRSAPRSGPT